MYRAVLGVFIDAKSRFILHLRPADVAAMLPAPVEMAELEAALRQLVAWGNLSADSDTAEVATVEEFYRARFQKPRVVASAALRPDSPTAGEPVSISP